MNKKLVYLGDFSKEEIYEIFKRADELAEDKCQAKPLEGKTVVLFFPESSIRTRVTFEKGIKDLGGNTILFLPSSLDKKEKLEDVMGFELEQCCPRGYELENIKTYTDIEEAVSGKDIICTDSIPDKAKEDFKGYQITLQHMQKANPGALLNPCPPFFRGEEVSADVINSEYFVGYGFKKHLTVVQQAILCYLLDK